MVVIGCYDYGGDLLGVDNHRFWGFRELWVKVKLAKNYIFFLKKSKNRNGENEFFSLVETKNNKNGNENHLKKCTNSMKV